MAALFGVIAMSAAYVGARLATFLTGAIQLSLLAVVMLAAAISMFMNARRSAPEKSADRSDAPPASLRLLLPVAVCSTSRGDLWRGSPVSQCLEFLPARTWCGSCPSAC